MSRTQVSALVLVGVVVFITAYIQSVYQFPSDKVSMWNSLSLFSRTRFLEKDGKLEPNSRLGPDTWDIIYKVGDNITYKFSGEEGRGFVLTKIMAQHLNTLNKVSQDEISIEEIANFPIVTPASSDHFTQAREMVKNTQDVFPGHPIYYIDLGLTPKQIQEVKRYCGVHYVKFNFTMYPEFVRHLLGYQFKMLIWQYMMERHPAFLYCDAAIRLDPCFKEHIPSILHKLMESGEVSPHRTVRNAFSTAHPVTYIWFPTNAYKLQRLEGRAAAFAFLSRKRGFVNHVVKWLVACALTKDCMSPPGAVHDCSRNIEGYNKCHKYDTTVHNVLLGNYFNYNVSHYDYPNTGCTDVRRSNRKNTIPRFCKEKHN